LILAKAHFNQEIPLVFDFEISQYGPNCQTLLADAPVMELGPGIPNRERHDQLEQLDAAAIFSGEPVVNPDMADCCRAGLWLLYNYLDESHRISQDIHTISGSYWHAVMHRREPDFSNSKYWFRQVGDHPIFSTLDATARQIAQSHATASAAKALAAQRRWDPAAFVDMCEAASRGTSDDRVLCRGVAPAEWEILFDDWFRSARGK